MRYAALFLFLVTGSCFAATPAKITGAADFGRKIAGATSWDSLFKSVDGNLNPLVMQELRALTNDLPYPQTRVKNDRLMITNENGERLTMVLEKNGNVSLNGKRWEIRPLASTEAEVQRIAAVLSAGHASLWDLVVPPARAGGLGMTMGVAAVAHTSAAAWKAEACAKPNPPEELVKTCSLMAVSMEGGVDPEMEKFYPVSLKCPAENGGVLESILKNKAGKSTRIQVLYSKDYKAQKITFGISKAETGFKFKTIVDVDVNDVSEKKAKSSLDRMIIQTDALINDVCLATKSYRARYDEMLNSNLKIVLSSIYQENFPVESNSKPGT